MAYSEKVIDHYENPRNVGSFDKDDPSVGTGLVGAPACGDVMKLQIKVSEDGIIEDAKFKTFGCGSAIASSSLATEWVKGKTIDQAMAIKNTQIVEELNLPPVKIHCSVLAEDAIKARSPTTRRSGRRAPATRNERGARGRTMAIAVSDRGGRRDQEGGRGSGATTPKGLRVGIRGGGCTGFSYLFEWSDSEPRPRTRCWRSRTARCACSSIRRASSILDGSTLEYQTTLMGRGFKFANPNAKGRAAAARASSSRRRHDLLVVSEAGGGGAALRGVRGAAAARRRGGSLRRAGAAGALRGRSGGGRGGLQGAVAAGAPRPLRDRRSARAARVAGADGSAQRRLADAQGSGAARRVPAHARGHRHRRQAADARQRASSGPWRSRRRPPS